MIKTEKPLGFGVIGLGNIAGHHIKSIVELEGCKLVAISSRNTGKLENLATQYKTEAFSDYHKLVAHPDVDVVCICTPSGSHLEPTLAAARAGKHVITEKPLEISVERGLEMILACEKANVRLACIFQNRYSIDYQQLYKAVQKGELGEPVLGNAYIKWYRDQQYYDATAWRGTLQGDGGAALINQAIHTIDLLLHVMGPVKSVFGKTKTMAHNIEGEDLGAAILEFESGALGTIEGSTAIYKGYPEKLEIHGTKGNIILEGGKITEWMSDAGNNLSAATSETSATGSSDPMAIDYKLHKNQIAEIAQNIRENREPVLNGREALKSVAVIAAIYQSAKTGSMVVLNK